MDSPGLTRIGRYQPDGTVTDWQSRIKVGISDPASVHIQVQVILRACSIDAPVTTAVRAVISSFSSSKRLTGLTDIRSEDGPPTVNREYTEASGDEWMILSAKHGSSTRRTSFAGRPMSPSRAERPRSDGTYFDELKPDCNQSPRLITALRLSLTVRPHG